MSVGRKTKQNNNNIKPFHYYKPYYVLTIIALLITLHVDGTFCPRPIINKTKPRLQRQTELIPPAVSSSYRENSSSSRLQEKLKKGKPAISHYIVSLVVTTVCFICFLACRVLVKKDVQHALTIESQ